MDVPLRDYMDSRFATVEEKIDGLGTVVRRELTLLSEDRERQRADLSERLEGMNALRKQLDMQAGTFATRERVESLEKTTWRAIGILAGLVLVIQVLMSFLLKGA